APKIKIKADQEQEHSGLPAGLSVVKQKRNQKLKLKLKLKRARSPVGAGLPAMASPRCIWKTELPASQASQLPQKSRAAPASDLDFVLAFILVSTTGVGFQAEQRPK
ncbi:hypothetical protein, partial [Pseudomonas sp. IPO3779]|uniref:hypothetical protein n=1 Tax=Pseudomonas sp. IPO3779 TaxID=2726977 RepID=UPI001C434D09